MKFWRHLVKSSFIFSRVLMCVLGVAAFACQQAKLAEYKPYANDNEVPRISVEDAKKEIDAGRAIMVDSRASDAYMREHIAGAVNLAPGSGDDRFSELPKGKKIIVYCD